MIHAAFYCNLLAFALILQGNLKLCQGEVILLRYVKSTNLYVVIQIQGSGGSTAPVCRI